MYKIPFYIASLVSCFVPGKENRHRVRGNINIFLFRIPISRFIKKNYGERARKIRFVRQVSTNRMTCLVNDRFFVKIFRDVTVMQLNEYKFLLNHIRPYLHVEIPDIFVAKHIPMYVADKLPGTDLREFDKAQIIKHERKIRAGVFQMIDELQAIPLKSIPNNRRFLTPIQVPRHGPRTYTMTKKSVLAHRDLNVGNLLLDSKFNLVSVVDWDSIAIFPDPAADRHNFEHMWDVYKNKH